MPGAMPGYVVKGRILSKIDAALNAPAKRRQLSQLRSARNLDGTWTRALGAAAKTPQV